MMKKLFALILALMMVLACTACGDSHTYNKGLEKPQEAVVTPEGTPITLTILTEQDAHSSSAMNGLLETLAASYMESHDNVTVEIQYLSQEEETRNVENQGIRSAMLAGDGPDILLFPTSYILTCEPFFLDPERAMRNGMFHEISAYYNADQALAKEELNQAVMNAGTIGDARYILPLRFDFPVLQINEQELAKHGLAPEDINGGLDALMDAVFASDDPLFRYSLVLSGGIGLGDLSSFGKCIDYESEKITLPEDTLAAYLRRYQENQLYDEPFDSSAIEGLTGFIPTSRTDLRNYIMGDSYWNTSGMAYHLDTLSSAYDSQIIAQMLDSDYEQLPLRALDGSVTATVTYWGAVGSGCEYPDVAYDFLREFLSRDSQWELSRTVEDSMRSRSLYGPGYPVRSHGAAANLINSVKNQIDTYEFSNDAVSKPRHEKLLALTFPEDGFPLEDIDEEIDYVRFGSVYDQMFLRTTMQTFVFNPTEGTTTASDIAPEELAKAFIREVEFYLAES